MHTYVTLLKFDYFLKVEQNERFNIAYSLEPIFLWKTALCFNNVKEMSMWLSGGLLT